ncbi:DUF805 domain-containing protein [Lacticaseibacillus brantae]|nr:DUF805 domain-containing protein [Lacticaseibacillus brantae]
MMKKIMEVPGQVSFGQAFKDFWRGYIEFNGRSTRAGYWWMRLVVSVWMGILLTGTTVSVVNFGMQFFTGERSTTVITAMIVFIALLILSSLALFLPDLALSVRRSRDVGLRGRGTLVIWAVMVVLEVIVMAQRMATQLAYEGPYGRPGFAGQPWLTNWVTLVFGLIFLIMAVLPTDLFTVKAESNGFMKFFFRVKTPAGADSSAADEATQPSATAQSETSSVADPSAPTASEAPKK